VGHRLEILVPKLHERRQKMALGTRMVHGMLMWGRARNVVMIPLRKASEHPEVIESVCRSLWTKSTGRSHIWSRFVPEEMNQLSRQISNTREKLDAAFDTRDPEAVQRVLDEMKTLGDKTRRT
jgi:hypothetical protein